MTPLWVMVVGGTMVGMQWMGQDHRAWADAYLWARYGLLATGLLLVLYDAFRDTILQGLLCLFLPMYILFYALSRVESYWRIGFFIGVAIGIGAELYFMPGEAILTAMNHVADGFIQRVAGWIQGAQKPLY